jgi:integrase
MKTLEVLDKALRGKRLRPHTVRQWSYVLKSLADYSEEWPQSSVVINEWLSGLKIADITARNYLSVVNTIGEYMWKNYHVQNPCSEVEKIKVGKRKRRYFTGDELMRILMSCGDDMEKLLILTLMDSLCRIGELGCDYKDMERYPGLRGSDVGDGFIRVKGKTGERVYHLDIRICRELKKVALSNAGDYVFAKADGSQANADCLSERVRKLIRHAGITGKKLGAHSIRHSGGTLVARATRDVFVVKELLQHDKIDTSMIYIHGVAEEDARKISPLQLMRDASGFGESEMEVSQLALGEGESMTTALSTEVLDADVVSGNGVNEGGSFADDVFPEIPEGDISIRPLLRSDDLKFLRRLMVVGFNNDVSRKDALKGRELLRRMLRKVK